MIRFGLILLLVTWVGHHSHNIHRTGCSIVRENYFISHTVQEFVSAVQVFHFYLSLRHSKTRIPTSIVSHLHSFGNIK